MNADDSGPGSDSSMRYGSAPDRRDHILHVVVNEGFCSISELASALDVSEMTVRRDIVRLEREGLLRRVHGGVTTLPREALSPSDYTERDADMAAAKRWIALAAVQLVERGATIGFDAGTTTHQLAMILPDNLRLTVATHSLPVLNTLASRKGVNVVGLGGELQPATQDFAGIATHNAIADLHLSVLFLAGRGINERGLFCGSDHEALVKRKFLEVSDRVVLLLDSTKFESAAMVRVCALDKIDYVVTDDGITEPQAAMLTSHGIKVIVAPRSNTVEATAG